MLRHRERYWEKEKERQRGIVEVSEREEERGCKSMTEIDKVKK